MKAIGSDRETVWANLPLRRVGAEIGVFGGAYSPGLLRQVRPTKLHLIDPWLAVDYGPQQEGW
jgi:hypothetical protein